MLCFGLTSKLKHFITLYFNPVNQSTEHFKGSQAFTLTMSINQATIK